MRHLAVAGLAVTVAAGVAGLDDGSGTDAETIRVAWKVVSAEETTEFEKNAAVAEG